MKVFDSGHTYWLANNKSPGVSPLLFFKDPEINGTGHAGTTNQEVLRALIDRVKFLNNQVQHEFNDKILYHLRMALILHEERHLERLVERGEEVELIEPTTTGHFV